MLLGLSFISVTFPIESAHKPTFLRQDVAVVKWHMVTLVSVAQGFMNGVPHFQISASHLQES